MMNTDTQLAFTHPEERAKATRDTQILDRISLRDHVVDVEIGAFQAERDTTQRISFNVVVEVVPLVGDALDDVDLILSYDKVTEAIAYELAAERLNLLETLAERVADRVLLEPQADRVFVRIEKLDRGSGALGVEIVRSLSDTGTSGQPVTEGEAPRPRVVYLTPAAQNSPYLPDWIDQLGAQAHPLILCVGPLGDDVPHIGHAVAQQRVTLLSIEQNGWVLAARDTRCAVVGTRTELDWAMKNGQICIWAPSKIVLDSVMGPDVPPADAMALSHWFAVQMNAIEFCVIGADCEAFPQSGLPVRVISATASQL